MTDDLIAQAWQDIEKAYSGFCCDEHRRVYRALFFSGAMSVMELVAGFDPKAPHVMALSVGCLGSVGRELTGVYHGMNEIPDVSEVRH